MSACGGTGGRHPSSVTTPAGDRLHQRTPRSAAHAGRARIRRLHEPVPLRASVPAQHGNTAASICAPRADRSRRPAAGRGAVVHRSDLPRGRVPDPESLHGRVPPHHRRHAASVPGRTTSVRPGRQRKDREMSTGGGGVEETRGRYAVDTAPSEPRLRPHDRDAVLVERLRRHETEAAEALVASYGDRVYRLAIRLTGDSADAEEVVQDALWAAIRKIDTFRGTSAFGSWVYRITANAAFQKRRGRQIERRSVAWDDLRPSFDETGQHVEPGLDWAPRLTDPALEAELRSALTTAIEALPVTYRAPLVLHDVEGLSNIEIAGALTLKLPTVKSRVHRARLFLRRRLAHYIGER